MSEESFSLICRENSGLNPSLVAVSDSSYLGNITGDHLTGDVWQLESQSLVQLSRGLLQYQVQQLRQHFLFGQTAEGNIISEVCCTTNKKNYSQLY